MRIAAILVPLSLSVPLLFACRGQQPSPEPAVAPADASARAGDEQPPLRDAWMFSGVPTIVLVDGEGVIVAVNEPLRGEALLPTLREFLRGE